MDGERRSVEYPSGASFSGVGSRGTDHQPPALAGLPQRSRSSCERHIRRLRVQRNGIENMLRMTKQADYGIVLMTHLASAHDRQQVSAPDLGAETRIPLPMVSKILKLLVRAGLLISHRGVKGGYALARPAREISVAALIEALDGPIAFTECIEEAPGSCSQESVCGVKENWQKINAVVRLALESITLADLTGPLSQPLVQLGGRSSLGQADLSR